MVEPVVHLGHLDHVVQPMIGARVQGGGAG